MQDCFQIILITSTQRVEDPFLSFGTGKKLVMPRFSVFELLANGAGVLKAAAN